MKNTLVMLLAGLMVLGLVGCKGTASEGAASVSASSVFVSQGDVSTPESDNQKPWGVEDRVTARNSNGTAAFYISFPELLGVLQGGGLIGEQPDGCLVIADGQDASTPEDVTNVIDVFPTFFVQAKGVLRGFYKAYAANYEFALADKREVKINEHDMAEFSGTLSYEYEREPVSCNWVAYATQVDENGAYAYWMVLDMAHNDKVDVDIADVALKMAQSYQEATW